VGGNYAELMRSSSRGPRIIYSESASLSPRITRSGFPAATAADRPRLPRFRQEKSAGYAPT